MIHTLRNGSCFALIKRQSRILISRTRIGQQQSLRLNVTTSSVNSYPDYKLVYKYPLVRLASLVNRLKFYQTFVTLAGIPPVFILAATEVITIDAALLYVYSGNL